jgi:uncharacterized protein YigA (DUF484 family)
VSRSEYLQKEIDETKRITTQTPD